MEQNNMLVKQGQELIMSEEYRKLALNMGVTQSLISRDYLQKLAYAEIIPLSEKEKNVPPKETIRLMRITNFVYDQAEDIIEKLGSLFGSLSSIRGRNIIMLLSNSIDGDSEEIEFYMGLSGRCVEDLQDAYATLEQAIRGNFPGCEIHQYYDDDVEKIMPDMVYQGLNCSVSSVSVDASQRKEGHGFVQGMEKFADGMRGKPYTLMLVATPVSRDELVDQIYMYRELYTAIAPYQKNVVTWNESHGDSFTATIGTQFSKTLSTAKVHSKGLSTSVSEGTNEAITKPKYDMKGSLIETGLTLLGTAGGVLFNAPGLSLAGSALGRQLRDASGAPQKSESESEQHAEVVTEQESEGEQTQEGEQIGDSQAMAYNNSHNTAVSNQMTLENKHITDLLASIDHQISRMSASAGQGAFHTAAYIITSDRVISETAASLYCSLLSGNQPNSVAYVNTWDSPEVTPLLQEYLLRCRHPRMYLMREGIFNDVDASVFVPCQELPLHFFWPRKSLPGLPVSRHAEFARSVPCTVNPGEVTVALGKVYHLGTVEKNIIYLPQSILSSHVCIAGSPGSGKSNLCYQILQQLMRQGVHFLVVEPAKGEYAKVLGGYRLEDKESVHCYTTRVDLGTVFSINPFAFPEGITALEHMEALLSLLNTCWPMYAAMTDIMKDAVIQIYEAAGWDMTDSGLPWDDEWCFPSFQDLMQILPGIIEQSDYSKEVKGNYKGSLLTRVKSMVNGTNRRIFGRDCISDGELFQQNVILDISGIGSSENRALMMGVLVIRLNEYRRVESKTKGMNRPLHHVTLIEEAHNLLSVNQTNVPGEGSTVGGKAVELLTGAIAEMRSYGEGFLIVDQTPSKLDQAVIANTATKIAFNLQNIADSAPMGSAMALTNEQAEEIPMLPQGVFVVRSRGWMSPVQVQADFFNPALYQPCVSVGRISEKEKALIRGSMLSALLCEDTHGMEKMVAGLETDDPRDSCLLLASEAVRSGRKLSGEERTQLFKNVFESWAWFYPPDSGSLWKWDRVVRKQLSRRAVLDLPSQNRIIRNLWMSQFRNLDQELLNTWMAGTTEHRI